jgi:hypothetical protein
MSHKKSQAAMEFLMTYGWALLVVIIVIAALAFFGLLNPSRFLPEKCDFGPGLTCMDFSAATDDTTTADGDDDSDIITVILNNGLSTTMNSVSINVTQCNNGTIGTIYDVPTIPEGSSQRFELRCGRTVANTRFKSDAIINYSTTTEDETVSHVKKGMIVVQVQKV